MFPLLDAFGVCSLCRESSWRPLATLPKSMGEVALIGCASCGIARRHPLPTEAEVAAFYETADGWDGDKPDPSSPKYIRALKVKHESYGPVTDRLEPLLRPPDVGAQRRVLDFGCGIGAFLDMFAARGWGTTGLEPGPISRQVAATRHQIVDDLPGTGEFDAVLVNHVLEHLRDPIEAVRQLARATVPDGRIFVQVPSFDNLPQHGRLRYVCGGVHIHSFSSVGLRSLLHAGGFDEIESLDGEEWQSIGRGRLASRAIGRRSETDPWDCGAPVSAEALLPVIAALRGYESRYSVGRPDALRGRNAGWDLQKRRPMSGRQLIRAAGAYVFRRSRR